MCCCLVKDRVGAVGEASGNPLAITPDVLVGATACCCSRPHRCGVLRRVVWAARSFGPPMASN